MQRYMYLQILSKEGNREREELGMTLLCSQGVREGVSGGDI